MLVRLIAIIIGGLSVFSIAVLIYAAIFSIRGSGLVPSRGSTDEIVGDRQLSWSPDGTSIAFISDRDGNEEIYVRDLETGQDTRVTNNEAPDSWPTWSPDGSRIAFLSSHPLGPDIFVTDADGTNEANLTKLGAPYSAPVWSPDGTRIAFSSDREMQPISLGTDPESPIIFPKLVLEIYVMNADGTSQTRLTFNQAIDGGVSWSPDGSRLAFHSDRDGDHDIYVMNVDGTGLTRLTDNDWSDVSPAWSPDGSRIAFASNRPLAVFGGNKGQEETDSAVIESAAYKFVHADGDALPRATHDIHVMNADGSHTVNLTQNPQVNFVTQPRWSPDSRFLAFDGRPGSPLGKRFAFAKYSNEVYVSPSGGTDAGAVPITYNPSNDPDLHMGPVWSPDSRSVAYVTRQTGTYRIRVKSVVSQVRRLDEEAAPGLASN